MRKSGFFLVFLTFLTIGPAREIVFAALSEGTEACLGCHETVTPGIVADWKRSRHAATTPAEALKKPALERRVSNPEIPKHLTKNAVGCYECHGLRAKEHKDNFEHFGYRINVVVSPEDCRTCHEDEAEQFAKSKKAHARDILLKNPVYHSLSRTLTDVPRGGEGDTALNESCYACHGTEVKVEGMRVRETSMGEAEFPELSDWPNQGVGRVNPDGSRGACTACHARHGFSIAMARKPYTCGQCHLQPDVPAFDVYKESKHGNIFLSEGDKWDWESVPWKPGVDYKAPSCASCHNSLLAGPEGEVLVPRTHDFGERLWVRIFGLIYAHPQPKTGKTYEIRNADDLPLPATFDGRLAQEHLIGPAEQAARRGSMKKICSSCHSSGWSTGHFARLDRTIIETDRSVGEATAWMKGAWDSKKADPKNPFDEPLEQLWLRHWLFYANSVRYASAMSGPDYAGFKNGWFELTTNLEKIKKESRGQ